MVVGGIGAVNARVVIWTEDLTAFASGFYTSAVASRRACDILAVQRRSPSC
jgi:hypothetical protein